MCDFCVALALLLPRGIGNLSRETCVAFARLHLCGIETAIAFAGRKWAFWCSCRAQRCRRFQRLLFRGEPWCCRFHADPILVLASVV